MGLNGINSAYGVAMQRYSEDPYLYDPLAIPRVDDSFGFQQNYATAINGVGAPQARKPTPTLTRVDDFLWRGKQPKPGSVAGLAQLGFRSTINLRTGDSRGPEEAEARANGMNFLSVPIKNRKVPKSDADVVKFLDFIKQPENQPAYIHCAKGVGRTGIMVACYRLAIPDANKLDANGNPRVWTAEEAIAEARANGLTAKKQMNYIRDFERKLKSGQIPGYPLQEPLAFGPGISQTDGIDINARNRPVPTYTPRMSQQSAAALTQQLYTNLFGRDADEGHALARYAPMIAAGRLPEVLGILSKSQEFTQRDPRPTDAEILNGLPPGVQQLIQRLGIARPPPEIPTDMPAFPASDLNLQLPIHA
jgi:protein tyrosine phosphatase (PTP) superfamily phosphohydrolase (DUF442 family)